MQLNELANNLGAKKNRKRVGRGIGSGKGKTCGRGVKGQKARSGVAIKGFEGGQTPMIKRLPKRGFNCPSTIIYQIVSINDIENLAIVNNLASTEIITTSHLVKAGLIKNLNKPIKLLGSKKKITKQLLIKFDSYSRSAKSAIEQANGQVL
jgi:large subunit ribosomal protein L15